MGEQDKGDADGLELTFSWGTKQGKKKKKMHELVTDHEQCYEANKLKCDGKKPD